VASFSRWQEKAVKYDFSVVFISLIITLFGLFNIYSATIVTEGSAFFNRQLVSVIIGIVLMIVFSFIDYRKLGRSVYIIYGINVLLLLVVLIIGRSALGARRWLSFGFINLQPSELMKISLMLVLARYFSNDSNVEGYTLRELLVPAAMAVIPAGLVIVQPDLGSGMMLLVAAFSVFLFTKIRTQSLIILGIVAMIALPLVYNFALKDYQKQRVVTFIDPASDPKGSGYNSIQSKIAVGSGRFTGKGYMKGTQSQLNFLPEHHTDFIFSVFSEEHGFIGSFILLILYSLLFISGFRIAARADDKFGVILAVGLTAVIFWQALINMGMVIGIMPVVGITLPFMSYGGTSMVINMIIIGFLQSIAIRRYMF
jgi:rod shape determining protein RodA